MSELAHAIAAQADLLEQVLTVSLDDALSRLEPARRIWLVGTGTSEHAAQLGEWMLLSGPRAVRALSSASLVARAAQLGPEDAVVVISHTTETAFARAARAMVSRAGGALVSITGRDKGWPEAVQTVPAERSETYTASYTAALLVLARLAVALATPAFGPDDLSELPGRVRAAAGAPPELPAMPERLVVLAGVGPAAVTAREGALKLREGARVLAEGYEAEYLLHGSAVPLRAGDQLIALAPPDDDSGLLPGLVAAASSEGLRTTTVREPERYDPLLAQIPLTVRLQGLACALADARGSDPDRVILGAWADADLWAAGNPDAA